jgi:hypothetical protein
MRQKKDNNKATKLSDLFEKYKTTLKAPQGAVIDCFIDVVKDVIGLPIRKESIKYTVYSKTLSVSVPGPLKSEIKLHKEEILAHMKGRLGEQNAPSELI